MTATSYNIEYLNPFIKAVVRILNEISGISLKRNNIYLSDGLMVECGLAVAVNIYKSLAGTVVYDLDRKLAIRLTETMNGISRNQLVSQQEFEELMDATIQEFANLVSGRAITLLEHMDLNCRIYPPELYIKKGLEVIEKSNQTIVVPMKTEFGSFHIGLFLQEEH